MSKLAKEVFGAQMWQTAILLCNVLVQLAVARYIGAEGLGVSAIVVGYASFCVLFIELNLQSALVREISVATASDVRELSQNVLVARLALAACIAPLVGVAAVFATKGNSVAIFLGVLGYVAAQELNPSWLLQGRGQSGRSFFLIGCAGICSCVAIPAAYVLRVPGVDCLLSAISGITIYGLFWKRESAFQHAVRGIRQRIVSYSRFAWRYRSFLLGGIAMYLYLYPARMIMASTRGVEDAGIYRIALMPATAYYAVTMAAFNTYYPRIVRAAEVGVVEYKRVTYLIVLIVFLAGVGAWLGTVILRKPLVAIIGEKFQIAMDLAPFLVISKGIGGLVLVARANLLAMARDKQVFIIFAVIGFCSLCLNLIIIPRYGILGAAIIEIGQEVVHLGILVGLILFAYGYWSDAKSRNREASTLLQ